jgi:hypothetical protein
MVSLKIDVFHLCGHTSKQASRQFFS